MPRHGTADRTPAGDQPGLAQPGLDARAARGARGGGLRGRRHARAERQHRAHQREEAEDARARDLEAGRWTSSASSARPWFARATSSRARSSATRSPTDRRSRSSSRSRSSPASPTRRRVAELAEQDFGNERVEVIGREAYAWHPDGIQKSKLARELGKGLRGDGTARNWNTVTKLLELADGG